MSESNVEELITSLKKDMRDGFQQTGQELSSMREQVVTLREQSAKRNGYVEAINAKLAELKQMIADRPCDRHGSEIEQLKIELALLQQSEGQDKERWQGVANVGLDVLKYVVTFAIGALLAYAWYKVTGVTP